MRGACRGWALMTDPRKTHKWIAMNHLVRKLVPCAAVLAVAAILSGSRLTAGSAFDPEADRILKSCCMYLADAKSLRVKVEAYC